MEREKSHLMTLIDMGMLSKLVDFSVVCVCVCHCF